ncbi:hypothetical protein OJ996_23505 [Luteolibacter sp. GHJ8]|uniref:DUF4384 domain-containing protein n=2 Tax=Luteolibacter rhizosphaerae TaxID=2989719 RepID=A0ABT3GAR3_9BACT|nr:hypothetical protein [Luteolibacter rhizosphaerae]
MDDLFRMGVRGIMLLALILSSAVCEARAVRSMGMKELVAQSALVFVGQVTSIRPSGITTTLTYPTWGNTVFEWLEVEVKVIEEVKGVKKGQVVRTLMLSIRGESFIVINPPGMVKPGLGQHHLLCLLPTTQPGFHASITAPFDDREGIFLLDRKEWTEGATYFDDKGRKVAFKDQNEKNAMLWNLVDGRGRIMPGGAAAMRKNYQAEIARRPPAESVVHLKWKKVEGKGGWQWNEPAEEKKVETRRRPKASGK